MTTIRVHVPAGEAKARYALGVLFDLLGVEPLRADAGHADLAYGDGGSVVLERAGGDWEAVPEVERVGAIPILRPPGADGGPDLVYAAWACLTAPWERSDDADEVGCPISSDGWLERQGLLREPLVHHYAKLLGERLGLAPRKRRVAPITLTHDVDDNFAHLFARRERLERLRRDVRARRLTALRRGAGLVRSLARHMQSDPNDRFDEWAALHRSLGGRPTYFVAARGIFHPGSDARDVAYDVRQPEVRATLHRALAEGAEIGVHFSIDARDSVERLRAEREELEDALDREVVTARHHWWALGRLPEHTWKLHSEAGVALDCSLGLNDAAGFRRGICSPFRPWDPDARGPAAMRVLPTVAMDAALFGAGRSVEEGVEALHELHRATGEAGGALVLDWHVHAANPKALPGAAVGLRRFISNAVAEGAELQTPLELLAEAS